MIKIHITSGEEVLETITKIFKEKDFQEGSIVSVIGAVDLCRISTMSKIVPLQS